LRRHDQPTGVAGAAHWLLADGVTHAAMDGTGLDWKLVDERPGEGRVAR
jgi:hypothetical protein